jgi:hypothetical protein
VIEVSEGVESPDDRLGDEPFSLVAAAPSVVSVERLRAVAPGGRGYSVGGRTPEEIPLSVEGRLDLSTPSAAFAERMASKQRQAAEGVDKSV